MSITTRKGDGGETDLMFGRRVPKSHPRVEAIGAVDELNAALGWVRATLDFGTVRQRIHQVQAELIVLMGELAVMNPDLERYLKAGFHVVTPEMVARLDEWGQELEDQATAGGGWALPGESLPSAALDMARTIARRAERRVCALIEAGELHNAEIRAYLNRLSDVLWLLARWVESQMQTRPQDKKRLV